MNIMPQSTLMLGHQRSLGNVSLFRVPLYIHPYWAFSLRLGYVLLGHHQRNCFLVRIGHSPNAPGPTPTFLHPIPYPYS